MERLLPAPIAYVLLYVTLYSAFGVASPYWPKLFESKGLTPQQIGVILAAALASGFWGIENKVEPDAVVEGHAYDRKFPERLALPRTLWEAAQRLKTSEMARDWFGEDFVYHFAASREWEEREFRKHITDWELARYFEII